MAGWIGVALVLVAGGVLRSLRLSWQPLWWDEGYSIYFATESLARMLWLTARDIHPPLYYTLLHAWFVFAGDTGPVTARALSVLFGLLALPAIGWLSLALLPGRKRVALLAVTLLAVNPLHLYYSQEVWMYGLAVLLAILATGVFSRMVATLQRNGAPIALCLTYILLASLSLHTVYFLGFLLVAHQLWAWLLLRRSRRALGWILAAAAVILLMQLPWWLYAVPQLIPYVADKVIADKDAPLWPWAYAGRHLLALLGGQIAMPQTWQIGVRVGGLLSLALIPVAWWTQRGRAPASADTVQAGGSAAAWALGMFTLVPLGLGFATNLRFPFFPEGGERLLLYLLPFVLIALSWAADVAWRRNRAWGLLLIPLLLASGLGIFAFYTTPRYTAQDYRPVVRHVAQNSRPADTVLAVFPWQVGYWRAYTDRTSDGAWLPPQPAPVDQEALRWNPQLAASLDEALARGTVWLPAPLSLGSTLPLEIEAYLAQHGRNLENRWFSPETRLSAWTQRAIPDPVLSDSVDFGPVALDEARVARGAVPADNTPLAVDLDWAVKAIGDYHVTLRLRDADGATWARRDYEPLGQFAAEPTSGSGLVRETLALPVPAGLPPGLYSLDLGVGTSGSDTLFEPKTEGLGVSGSLVSLAPISVTLPGMPLAPQRLAIEQPLAPPAQLDGLKLLGSSGLAPTASILAGTDLPLTVFFQSTAAALPDYALHLKLLAGDGDVATEWAGWPLPTYLTSTWLPGALVQVPASLHVPPDLAPGNYTVAVSLQGQPAADLAPIALGEIQVDRRPVSKAALLPEDAIDPPVQFGTHIQLMGNTVEPDADGLHVALDWRVLQTLLPAHHIFVHLVDPAGSIVAQNDGPPTTATGPAPSGSWLPDEYLRTHHFLSYTGDPTGLSLRVGLYLPDSEARLPAYQGTSSLGDSAEIPVVESE